jgi:hypothetical protein
MRQRFTVELEMTVISRAVLDVIASDIAEARARAMEAAGRDSPNVWELDPGPVLVKKITAHGGPHLKPVPK